MKKVFVRAASLVIPFLVSSTVLAQTNSLPTYSATEAAKHVGEYATVADKVVGLGRSQRGDICLEMGGKYPNQAFMAVISVKSAWKFSDYRKYVGQMVAVFGKIILDRKKPIIFVSTRTQFVLR